MNQAVSEHLTIEHIIVVMVQETKWWGRRPIRLFNNEDIIRKMKKKGLLKYSKSNTYNKIQRVYLLTFMIYIE